MADIRIQTLILLGVVVAQLGTLSFMAANREYIISNGERLFLRTAPVDPRDPFRGDYVRLGYDFNQVSQAQYRGTSAIKDIARADRVYAVLKPEGDQVYRFDYLTDTPPTDNLLYIAGRNTTSKWVQQERSYLDLRYGIEKYFVEQGKGREMEEKIGRRSGLQIPLEIEIALGKKGIAVITGYRWSSLGIKLDFVPSDRNAQQITSPEVTFTIENVSSQAISLATDNAQCVFRLEIRNPKWLQQISPGACDKPSLQTTELAPGEHWSANLDLNQPRWYVQEDNHMKPVHQLSGWNQVQVIYHPPEQHDTWRGELRSPRFTANRRID